jgi:hypothetical protein
MKENMRTLSFWDWLISLSMVISSFINLPSNSIISFFFIIENDTPLYVHKYVHMYIYPISLIHSSVEGICAVSKVWLLWIVLQ